MGPPVPTANALPQETLISAVHTGGPVVPYPMRRNGSRKLSSICERFQACSEHVCLLNTYVFNMSADSSWVKNMTGTSYKQETRVRCNVYKLSFYDVQAVQPRFKVTCNTQEQTHKDCGSQFWARFGRDKELSCKGAKMAPNRARPVSSASDGGHPNAES